MLSCSKCKTAHFNIWYDRVPTIFLERAVQEYSVVTLPISEIFLWNDDALRLRIFALIASIGVGNEITPDSDLTFVANVFKIKVQHSFDIGNDKMLVVCDGDKCKSFYIKKNCGNISVTCKQCIGGKYDNRKCREEGKLTKICKFLPGVSPR